MMSTHAQECFPIQRRISNPVLIVAATILINALLFSMIPLLAKTERARMDYGEPATVVKMNQPELLEVEEEEPPKVIREDDLKRLPEDAPMMQDQKSAPPPPQMQLNMPEFDLAIGGKGISGMEVIAPPAIAGIDSVFNINELDTKPKLISRIQPIYPFEARKRKISGRVFLTFIVDQNGNVKNVTVTRAEPEGIFEKSAIEAVLKWRFEAGMYKGKPVDTRVSLPIRFDM